MSVDPENRDEAGAVTRPRPGHADLAGMQKYDTHDARDILERASARETAARTVAGYLSKQLLDQVGIAILSHVVAIGEVRATGSTPGITDRLAIDQSPVRTADTELLLTDGRNSRGCWDLIQVVDPYNGLIAAQAINFRWA